MNLYIKVGSVTFAQRGFKILKSRGYKTYVKRIENIKKGDGCGYELVVDSSDDTPIKILESNGFKIRGAERR